MCVLTCPLLEPAAFGRRVTASAGAAGSRKERHVTDEPVKRVYVSLGTVAMYCGERTDATFEINTGTGDLPTLQLYVTSWSDNEADAEALARQFVDQIHRATVAILYRYSVSA